MRALGNYRSIFTLGILITTSNLAAINYQLTQLDGFSDACAINSLGQVVGYSSSPDGGVAVYNNGTYTQIASAGIGNIYASAINDAGQVVGEARFGNADQAFVYSNGSLTSLGTFTGGYSSSAADINNKGQIVGNSSAVWTPDDVLTHPAFIVDHGPMQRLTQPSYDLDAFIVESVNNAGQVVGWNKWTGHSMVHNPDGSMIDIGPGLALEMNDKGQVAGITRDAISSAWVYQDGKTTQLGSLPGQDGQSATITGMNNLGQVVGMSGNKPFLYDRHTLYDLTSLLDPAISGWTELSVRAINDSGMIVGTGYTADGVQRGFLLTPSSMTAPEPGNALMLLVGGMLLATRHASTPFSGIRSGVLQVAAQAVPANR